MNEYELYHHGVKGMKWGIRKDKLSRVQRKAKRGNWSDDARTASEIRTKKPKQMTNAEMRKLNERTRLEREYQQLHPNAVTKGISYVGKSAAVMGTVLLFAGNSGKVISLGKSVGNKIIDVAGDMVMRDLNRRLNG